MTGGPLWYEYGQFVCPLRYASEPSSVLRPIGSSGPEYYGVEIICYIAGSASDKPMHTAWTGCQPSLSFA